MKDAIYTEDNKTWVCFGTGSIVVAAHNDDIGQEMLWLGDTKESHKIGLDSGVVDWSKEIPGHTVVLGFNKVSSIDVVLEALTQMKGRMLKQKEAVSNHASQNEGEG